MDKKKLELLIKCIAAVLALGVFCVLFAWSKDFDKGTDTSYEVVCMGDSNFGNVRDESGIVSILGKQLGKNTLNGAFGGSMLVAKAGNKTEYHSVLSMHNLAISICNRSFGTQKAAIQALNRRSGAENYVETLDNLAKVDFESVELLIIEHGVNDYLSGVPIKNGRDLYDTSTFCGTLRNVVNMLREEYPNLRIVLVTPAYCAPIAADGTYRYCDETSYGAGYLEEYVDAELEVADELGVEIIDLYHTMDINQENFDTYLYDGLHFNEYGREIVADILAECLLGDTE